MYFATFPRADFSNSKLAKYLNSLNRYLTLHTDYAKSGSSKMYLGTTTEDYLNRLSKDSIITIFHIKFKGKVRKKIKVHEIFKKISHRWIRIYYHEVGNV